jgi:ribosomal protein L11 methyltransferase
MKFLQILINTTSEGIEPLSDRLIAMGADDFAVEDESDFLAFLENNKKYWDYVDEALLNEKKGVSRIKLFVGDNAEGRAVLDSLPEQLADLRRARNDVDFGPLDISYSVTDDSDWANAWKQYYKPFKVGKKLYVKPEWEQLNNDEGRIVYISNPGLAFGSGIHETTRLCMCALEEAVDGGENVLDLGCGSGILSIVALLLGANSAKGVDIDEKAAEVSRENAARNGVADRCEFICGDILADKNLVKAPKAGFDIVCANIVADVIIGVSTAVYGFLRRGGTLISSGIIDVRLPEVCEALKNAGLRIKEIKSENGWRAVIAEKP